MVLTATDEIEPTLSEQDFRDQADFRAALRSFLSFSEQQARVRGITPRQHLVLLLTRGHASYPRVAVGELAAVLKLSPSTTSLLVDRAVHRGLLQRMHDDADRRRVFVSLTVEGQRILNQMMRVNRQEMRTLEGALFRESLRQDLQANPEETIPEILSTLLPASPSLPHAARDVES